MPAGFVAKPTASILVSRLERSTAFGWAVEIDPLEEIAQLFGNRLGWRTRERHRDQPLGLPVLPTFQGE